MNNDVVNHPAHYTDGKFETIEAIDRGGLVIIWGMRSNIFLEPAKSLKIRSLRTYEKPAGISSAISITTV